MDKELELAKHLHGVDPNHLICWHVYDEHEARRIASRILVNPQEHIDALVEAGVLTRSSWDRDEAAYYEIVQPHTHDWRVRTWREGAITRPPFVRLMCDDCGDERSVPNRLPIEIPE